jgi:UDP-2,4-diacetamido-2,4,6-trideoxy-beta-L-altropyranose hydrolase
MEVFLPVDGCIVFYGNASTTLGAGHLSRLLALAASFSSTGSQRICFYCKECPQSLAERINAAGFSLKQAPAVLTTDALRSLNPQLLLIDDYHLNAEEWLQIAAAKVPVIVIDDQVSATAFYADLVINPAPQATVTDYKMRTQAQLFCLGPAFTILRPEFSVTMPVSIELRQRLLVTLGGADVKQLALPLSQALLQRFITPCPEICLVLGSMNISALPELQQLTATYPQFRVEINSNQMATLMANSGLAIAAAGGTLGELAAMTVPTLALICVDNQLPALTSPLAGGWYQAIDLRQLKPQKQSTVPPEINTLADKAFTLWQDLTLRTVMSQLASQIVDTKGCERIVQQAQQLLVRRD